jgi:hypothetical protein
MSGIFQALLAVFVFQATVQAADKIRIGLPADAGHFTFPLAQKKGFLKSVHASHSALAHSILDRTEMTRGLLILVARVTN